MINNNYSNLYSLLIFDELCRKVQGTIIVEFYRKEGIILLCRIIVLYIGVQKTLPLVEVTCHIWRLTNKVYSR